MIPPRTTKSSGPTWKNSRSAIAAFDRAHRSSAAGVECREHGQQSAGRPYRRSPAPYLRLDAGPGDHHRRGSVIRLVHVRETTSPLDVSPRRPKIDAVGPAAQLMPADVVARRAELDACGPAAVARRTIRPVGTRAGLPSSRRRPRTWCPHAGPHESTMVRGAAPGACLLTFLDDVPAACTDLSRRALGSRAGARVQETYRTLRGRRRRTVIAPRSVA